MVTDPVTCSPDATLADVDALCAQVPHLRGPGHRRRTASWSASSPTGTCGSRWTTAAPVREVMTHAPLITARVGVTAEAALGLLRRHKLEKLPIIDGDGILRGLITIKDFNKTEKYPLATKDPDGRLVVAAAVGRRRGRLRAGDAAGRGRRRRADGGHRARALAAGAGDGGQAARRGRRTRWTWSAATWPPGPGAAALVEAGADAVKVGRRAGLDLHHPGGGRGRRAADHRDLRGGAGVRAGRACR